MNSQRQNIRAMFLVSMATLVMMTSAQTFSFGTNLGHSDIIPAFDSQRSSVSIGNPFTNFGPPSRSFEDFFSSSRVASRPRPSPVPVRTAAPARSSASVSVRQPNLSPVRQANPVPVPVRGAPVAPARSPSSTSSRGVSSSVPAGFRPDRRESSRTSAAGVVLATPELSSRGRVQEEPVASPPVTRPPSTTQSTVPDVRENLVGQSVCARGKNGDACREHLALTAMACTSGFCQECQQCGTMSPDQWPKCCREHNLCCRPLGRACQSCDTPILTPFCGAAFGRCN